MFGVFIRSRKLDECESCARRAGDCIKADAAGRGFFTGLSTLTPRLVVEALWVLSSSWDARVVLEALEIESRILWNFRLVVLKATVIVYLREDDELRWGVMLVRTGDNQCGML